MKNENLSREEKAQKAIEAVAFIFAVVAEKTNPFVVVVNEFFQHFKIHLLHLNEDEVYEYFNLLKEAEVIRNETQLTYGTYRVDYYSLVNLLISGLEAMSKPKFLVLCGWENVVRQESIPESIKEFLIAYQTLNVEKYFETRITPSDVESQEPYFDFIEN